MILAPTLSLNSTARGLDADATAFAAASGATDVAALSAFVKGVKELGLWNNMVCWPLRSTQNAGTGTTAYSLGGLGTFNGTLVNGPTWGADGVLCNATNKEIQLLDEAALYLANTGFVVFSTSSTANDQRLFDVQDAATFAGTRFALRYTANTNDANDSGPRFWTGRTTPAFNLGARPVFVNQFQTVSFAKDDTSDTVWNNGSVVVNGARTGLTAMTNTGARNLRQMFSNSTGLTGAFGMLSSARWSNANASAFHALYKTTLGAGLGLP